MGSNCTKILPCVRRGHQHTLPGFAPEIQRVCISQKGPDGRTRAYGYVLTTINQSEVMKGFSLIPSAFKQKVRLKHLIFDRTCRGV